MLRCVAPSPHWVLTRDCEMVASSKRTLYTVCLSWRLSMPEPMVALPWGSRSTINTRCPTNAKPAARLTVVVVLPTPPFWFATQKILAIARSRFKKSSMGDGLDYLNSAIFRPKKISSKPVILFNKKPTMRWALARLASRCAPNTITKPYPKVRTAMVAAITAKVIRP